MTSLADHGLMSSSKTCQVPMWNWLENERCGGQQPAHCRAVHWHKRRFTKHKPANRSMFHRSSLTKTADENTRTFRAATLAVASTCSRLKTFAGRGCICRAQALDSSVALAEWVFLNDLGLLSKNSFLIPHMFVLAVALSPKLVRPHLCHVWLHGNCVGRSC